MARVLEHKERGMQEAWKKEHGRQLAVTRARDWVVPRRKLLRTMLEEKMEQCEHEEAMVEDLFEQEGHAGGVEIEHSDGMLCKVASLVNPLLDKASAKLFIAQVQQCASNDADAAGVVFPVHFLTVARQLGLHRFTSLYKFFLKHATLPQPDSAGDDAASPQQPVVHDEELGALGERLQVERSGTVVAAEDATLAAGGGV